MKRNSDIIRWIAAAFLTLTSLALPHNALAGIAVSPLQQKVVVKPGDKADFTISVTNVKRGFGTPPRRIKVTALDFAVSPQGNLSFGEQNKHSRSAVEWISFDTDEFILEPGESKKVKGKVSAPGRANGDYWAAVMIQPAGSKKQKEGVRVAFRTASGLFIRVDRRNYHERATIVDANVVLPEFSTEQKLTEKPDEEQNSPKAQQEQALEINAELKNDGIISFRATGKAFLYSKNWRRMASIPLHTDRRRILPGHSRCYSGFLSQPLPAGLYKMRVFFNNGAKYGRKIIKDMEFAITEELARQWAENFTNNNDKQILQIEPQKFEQTLTPGRFTAVRFLVTNRALSTVSIRSRLEQNEMPQSWLELKSDEFTLNPNMRHSLICAIRIPPAAQKGQYNATVHLEMERSGLTGQNQDNIEHYQLPIRIAITE